MYVCIVNAASMFDVTDVTQARVYMCYVFSSCHRFRRLRFFFVHQCACDILEWAGPFIEASLATAPFEGYPVHCAGHSFGGAVAACLAGLLDGAIDVEAEGRTNGENPASRPAEDKNRGANARRRAGEQHQGRRKAGGVAWSESVSDSDSDGSGESDGEDILRVDGAAPWVGVCRDKVTCVTLGCPPCLSRSLRLPFVTSFVLGDDMVPRTSHESLRRLKRRLLQVRGWVGVFALSSVGPTRCRDVQKGGKGKGTRARLAFVFCVFRPRLDESLGGRGSKKELQ